MGKYDHLVHTFEKQINYYDILPPVQAYFRGHDSMPDSNFYSPYRCYIKDAFNDKVPNIHSEEEYLCFIGYDMTDPWGSFDAEIEFWIGKDLHNLEQHIITKPTIVRIPPFTWHCPLQYRNVKKPLYLQVLAPRGRFGLYTYKPHEDGTYHIEYSTAGGAKQCVMEPEKKCTMCGKCRKPNKPGDPANATESALSYRNVML